MGRNYANVGSQKEAALVGSRLYHRGDFLDAIRRAVQNARVKGWREGPEEQKGHHDEVLGEMTIRAFYRYERPYMQGDSWKVHVPRVTAKKKHWDSPLEVTLSTARRWGTQHRHH
tara:strand:+ start:2950 stop:3294 length:345 start_codon:yes stop_codon:yes gene_type:complete